MEKISQEKIKALDKDLGKVCDQCETALLMAKPAEADQMAIMFHGRPEKIYALIKSLIKGSPEIGHIILKAANDYQAEGILARWKKDNKPVVALGKGGEA